LRTRLASFFPLCSSFVHESASVDSFSGPRAALAGPGIRRKCAEWRELCVTKHMDAGMCGPAQANPVKKVASGNAYTHTHAVACVRSVVGPCSVGWRQEAVVTYSGH
jgi:hypothetical protein